MNWDDARYLLAVRRARNLTAAAATLGVSHTTVARRLAAFARELEVRLIDRTPEGPKLTPAALELAALAEEMERAADAIGRRVAGAERRLRGTVRVTATEGIGSAILAPALAELSARHPGLAIDLIPDPRSFSLARREADVAVRLVRPRERSTVGRRIGRMAWGLYASADYLASPREVERLLAYGPPVAGAETAWLARRFPGGRVVLRTASTQALQRAAVAGRGVAALPCFVGDPGPSLVRLAGPGDLRDSELWLAVHRDLRRSAPVAAVAECIRETFARAAPALEGRPAA